MELNVASNWDQRFIQMAQQISTWSKDPSTKCGCVIVRPNNSICSVGFNGFPSRIMDRESYLNDRDKKYPRIIHAEMNAIMFATEPLYGYRCYTTGPPCERCAAHLVQVGISGAYWAPPTEDYLKRWSMDTTVDMFSDSGIRYGAIT